MKTSMRGAGQRANRGWVGVPTFLRSDYCPDPSQIDADIAFLGIPFDEGSPFAGGSRFAPRSLREHSLRFGGTDGFYDVERDCSYLVRELKEGRMVDLGDVDILPTNVEGSFANVTALIRQIVAQNVLPVALGGDHAISYPIVRAFNGPLHVVQLDAHLDYGAPNLGMNHTNGQPFRLIHQLEQVTGLTQVGIRSLRNAKAVYDEARTAGSQIITMRELRLLGMDGIAGSVPRGVRCYVSIDIDALDIALTPGCVSAEPNGMTYGELRDCFAAIATGNEIVGFDLVEVNPLLDVGTGVTSYLAVHLIIELLGILCQQPWWHARLCHAGAA
jgi:agmatinase